MLLTALVSIKIMNVSKYAASDPKPVNKGSSRIFPLLPVQFQCNLLSMFGIAYFLLSLKNQRLIKAIKQAALLLQDRAENALKAWGHFLFTNFFSCLGSVRNTGDLWQSAQRETPTTCWNDRHISPDQHPVISQLVLTCCSYSAWDSEF